MGALAERRDLIADVLVAHTRLSDGGLCYCGLQGRLGDSFAKHQADAIVEAVEGIGAL